MEKTHNGLSKLTVVIRGEALGWGSFKKVPWRCKGDDKVFASFKSLTIWVFQSQDLEMDGSNNLDGLFKCLEKKRRIHRITNYLCWELGSFDLMSRSLLLRLHVNSIGKQYRLLSFSTISLSLPIISLCWFMIFMFMIWFIYLLLLNNKIYYGWFTMRLSRRQIWVCDCYGRINSIRANIR